MAHVDTPKSITIRGSELLHSDDVASASVEGTWTRGDGSWAEHEQQQRGTRRWRASRKQARRSGSLLTEPGASEAVACGRRTTSSDVVAAGLGAAGTLAQWHPSNYAGNRPCVLIRIKHRAVNTGDVSPFGFWRLVFSPEITSCRRPCVDAVNNAAALTAEEHERTKVSR